MHGVVKATLFVVVATLAGGAAYAVLYPRVLPVARPPASVAPVPSAARSVAPGTVVDPLSPDRPALADTSRPGPAGDWLRARPGFQYSHTVAQRGGADPCATPTGDTSSYGNWVPLIQGHFMAPRALELDASGHFELVIHLHGDEQARRELLKSEQPFVLYALTLSLNQSYAPLFSGSFLFDAIVAGIEQNLSKRLGKPAHVGHIAFSAWSAGFVGIEAALSQPFANEIDGVLLIDGLHAPRNDPKAFQAQLKPFVDYAARAAAKERFFFVSHSSIDPADFASTTECAHYLVSSLGGKPEPVKRGDPLGLELVEYFNRGDFNVRGYAGNDKADHCAQLGTLRGAYAALGRRWHAAAAR